MKGSRAIALGVACLALAGVAGYEAHVASAQPSQLRAARQRLDRLAADTAALRREHDAVTRETAQAEQQLAALPAPKPDNRSVPTAHRTEISHWLARVKRLHHLFDEHPDQRIPEMQLLKDEDWLRVAKNANFESQEGIRQAHAATRGAAITRFGAHVSPALRKFASSSNPETPVTALTLAPYLEGAVDTSLLERYELRKSVRSTLGGSTEWIVQNKAPIDQDYDERFEFKASNIGNYGGGSLPGPMAWIPDFRERLQRASNDYRRANKSAQPSGIADVLPFFNPPLDPATAEKVIRFDREHRR